MSRGLAEAMGGTLTVVSREGLGATFTVSLRGVRHARSPPLAAVARISRCRRPGSRDRRRTGRGCSTSRTTCRTCASSNASSRCGPDWRLTHAADGATGLDLALASAYDLVLLDQNLPDLHGLEVLRQLRSRENRLDVPVVILSADAAQGKVARAIRAGASDYLVKPFTVEGLLSVLDEYAPR